MSIKSSINGVMDVRAKDSVVVIDQSDHHLHSTLEAQHATAADRSKHGHIGLCRSEQINMMKDREAYNVCTDEHAEMTLAQFKKHLRQFRKKGGIPLVIITEDGKALLTAADYVVLMSVGE
jgi:hypothetical protein